MSLLSIIQINIEIVLAILCVAIWILTKVWSKDNQHPFRYIWRMDLLTVGLLISDTFAIVHRGSTTPEGYYIVRAANFFTFFFLYGLTLYMSFFVEFLFKQASHKRKRILASKIISAITLVSNFINLFIPFVYDFDAQNRYFRKEGWYINAIGHLIVIIMLATVVYELRSEVETGVYVMVLADILMPLIATVVQVFIYGISITCIAIGITQLMQFMIIFRYQELKIKETTIQLSEYNAKLMLTQVQPHFTLNALSTIQYLCKHDSEAAFDAISDFSIYLRNNMEFATTTEMIPFEKELSHIEKYVSIEKRRFGDRVNVVYNIKEKDFGIPPLSVQPLVENAIKHGISKKRDGGTVELSAWRGANNIHIVVKDDGVGFDMDKPFSDDRVHLGLPIVRDRLEQECGGDMIITSEENKGTVCEIIIPIEFNK